MASCQEVETEGKGKALLAFITYFRGHAAKQYTPIGLAIDSIRVTMVTAVFQELGGTFCLSQMH